MYQVHCMNNIAKVGTDELGPDFALTDDADAADAFMVRSANLHEVEFSDKLLAIARAGAGVNNIPLDTCAERGIVVFNTPGANANAVKELVLCALFLTSRKVAASMDWVKTLKGEGDQVGKLVEKGKSAFAGPEIKGKTLGVVGLGAIGILVANAAEQLGMTVYGYDPYLSVDSAWRLSSGIKRAVSVDDLCQCCDYLTLHLPATKDTKGMINAESIAKMQDGVRILNFARGELVDSAALLAALQSGKVAAYATDFPTDDLIGVENVTALPHLGATTPEAEEKCAVMAAQEILD